MTAQVHVGLNVQHIQLLDGASECAAQSVASSLAPQNARVSAWISQNSEATQHAMWPLLVDPQTGENI